MKKHILSVLAFLLTSTICFGAWDATHPTDSSKIKDVLETQFPNNFDAIALGTDPALQITNAKVSATASIADTKLGTISTAGKVNGTAITNLGGVPSGAGALPIVNGGTGQSTRQGALNALSAISLSGTTGLALVSDGSNIYLGKPLDLSVPSSQTGDLLYYNGTNWTRLAAGTSGYALKSQGVGIAPIYGQIDLSTSNVVNTLPISKGGTGQTTATASLNAILPDQSLYTSGGYLTTNGSTASWSQNISGVAKSGFIDDGMYCSMSYCTNTNVSQGVATTRISGIGFQPKSVVFILMANYCSVQFHDACSGGSDDGTNHDCFYEDYSSSQMHHDTDDSIRATCSGYQVNLNINGHITSFDSDGFTITWTYQYYGQGAGPAHPYLLWTAYR